MSEVLVTERIKIEYNYVETLVDKINSIRANGCGILRITKEVPDHTDTKLFCSSIYYQRRIA